MVKRFSKVYLILKVLQIYILVKFSSAIILCSFNYMHCKNVQILFYLVNCAHNRPAFFAEKLHDSMEVKKN